MYLHVSTYQPTVRIVRCPNPPLVEKPETKAKVYATNFHCLCWKPSASNSKRLLCRGKPHWFLMTFCHSVLYSGNS